MPHDLFSEFSGVVMLFQKEALSAMVTWLQNMLDSYEHINRTVSQFSGYHIPLVSNLIKRHASSTVFARQELSIIQHVYFFTTEN